MSSENESNASDSARTSPPAPPSNAPAKTAGEYLAQQQEQAKDAIRRCVAEMGDALKEAANLKDWTRQYPWLVTGTAVATGFVTGLLVMPRRDQTFKEKYEKLREKVKRDDRREAIHVLQQAQKEEEPSWLGSLLQKAMSSVGPVLTGLITSAMAQQTEQGAQENGNGNGRHSPQGDFTSDNPQQAQP